MTARPNPCRESDWLWRCHKAPPSLLPSIGRPPKRWLRYGRPMQVIRTAKPLPQRSRPRCDIGGRTGMEHTTGGVLLAKATGRAGRVVWPREEDLRVDQHRTAFLGRARLGLGADGMPVAYEAKIACDGLWQRLFPWFYAKKKPVDLPTFSLVGSSYGIPNEAGTYVNVPLPVRVGAF